MRALVLLLLTACSVEEYRCVRDEECVGDEGGFGMCIEDHCALYDATCPLELPWRYDEAGGPVAGECVESDRTVSVLLSVIPRGASCRFPHFAVS
jgi:hypothetical protein